MEYGIATCSSAATIGWHCLSIAQDTRFKLMFQADCCWNANGYTGTPFEGVIAAILGMVTVGSVVELSVLHNPAVRSTNGRAARDQNGNSGGLTLNMVGLVNTSGGFVSMPA
ncbi:hypothetical protein ACEN88_18735 [Massilia sp. CT11-108]|uniref:hypothetical protein n=1 Tax=Massilia sp. CT11-108 TaxID=3393900 RepID=UPI0039A43801